jgi:hypothetical protein
MAVRDVANVADRDCDLRRGGRRQVALAVWIGL